MKASEQRKQQHDEHEHVPMSKWGKDHWSVIAYIETRIVDYKGVPDADHMRTDHDIHPQHVGNRKSLSPISLTKKYPTRLSDGSTVDDHDDWTCLEDAEREGLLESHGTGIHPWYKLTKMGHEVLAALRKHKAAGKNFVDFRWPT